MVASIFAVALLMGFPIDATADLPNPATQVCRATETEKTAIDDCLRQLDENECMEFPQEQRRNCFDPRDTQETDFAKACGKGTLDSIKGTVEGVRKIAANLYNSATNHRKYNQSVLEEASRLCADDKDVRRARETWEQAKKNIGTEAAMNSGFLDKSNATYAKCIAREQAKGNNFGLAMTLPDMSEITGIANCLNSKAQTEVICGIAIPMLAGGASVSVVKAAIRKSTALASARKVNAVTKHVDEYISHLKKNRELSQAEVYSLRHQEDLISLTKNPLVRSSVEQLDIDLKAMTSGILDSDLGKLDRFKTLLTSKSPESDRLLKVLNRSDTTSPAGRAFAEFLDENGMSGRAFFNPTLNPDQIRQVIAQRPILTGYLHEAPGMIEAIDALNRGEITKSDFKLRIGANLGHNGPQAGFWDFLTKLTSGQMKGDAYSANFFKGSIFEGNVTDGVTGARYIAPMTREGLVHTMADRLSQGTSGGNLKIFFELSGRNLEGNLATKIGEIPGIKGPQNGLNTFRDLLEGNPGAGVRTNAAQTVDQLKALKTQAEKANFLSPTQKKSYAELVTLAEKRTLAFQDYMQPPQLEFIKDASGSVEKILLRGPAETGAKYIGTITRNTPTNEAVDSMRRFFDKEEAFNGHPFKDLGIPRKVSPSELPTLLGAVAGGATSSLYFYCNRQANSPSLPVRRTSPVAQ